MLKVKAKKNIIAVLLPLILCSGIAMAQTAKPLSVINGTPDEPRNLNFPNTPLDQVLALYSDITGKTIIVAPNVAPITIKFKSQTTLTETEVLIALETLLSMNNISLVPLGDKFLKAVQAATALQEAIDVRKPGDEQEALNESDNVISQLIEMKHTSVQEIQPIVQSLIHSYGKLQVVERSNSIMVTDTEATIAQIVELIEYMDKPYDVREEPKIYEIKYASASEVGAKLQELISQSQEDQKAAGTLGRTSSSSSVLRNRVTAARTSGAAAASGSQADKASRGVITGNVLITPDDRTNILIVISDPVNFVFFDEIVEWLDRQVNPEIGVKVLPLEFADAEEISGIINELIGAATEGDDAGGAANRAAGANDAIRSSSLRTFVANRNSTNSSSNPGSKEGGLEQLAENTRILADPRTNSILLMGKVEDFPIIEKVVADLDVMLAQVLVEAVILEVNLGDGLEYGFDWLQRSLTVVNNETRGPVGGVPVSEPVYSFGGGQSLVNGAFQDGSQIGRAADIGAGGLTYFATFFDFNIDAILRLAGSSSDARVLSSPVILTTDNTEAQIVVGEQRPIPTSSSTTAGGVIRSTFEYRDIGITLKVTPRVNPNGFVIMDITQSADNVGGTVTIDGNEVPIITRRELQANIGVSNRTTIVLGGMVSEDTRDSITKTPFLGDMPIFGNLFRSESQQNLRSEILVLITPYVLTSPQEAARETARLHHATKAGDDTWYRGWSDSRLAEEKAHKPFEHKFNKKGILNSPNEQRRAEELSANELAPKGIYDQPIKREALLNKTDLLKLIDKKSSEDRQLNEVELVPAEKPAIQEKLQSKVKDDKGNDWVVISSGKNKLGANEKITMEESILKAIADARAENKEVIINMKNEPAPAKSVQKKQTGKPEPKNVNQPAEPEPIAAVRSFPVSAADENSLDAPVKASSKKVQAEKPSVENNKERKFSGLLADFANKNDKLKKAEKAKTVRKVESAETVTKAEKAEAAEVLEPAEANTLKGNPLDLLQFNTEAPLK